MQSTFRERRTSGQIGSLVICQTRATGGSTQGSLVSWSRSGALLDRSICIQNECAAANVLQLEARPSSLDRGCLHNPLEGSSSVYVPPILSDLTLPVQAQSGGDNSHSDSSSVAKPGLVPTASEEPSGLATVASTSPGHPDQCVRPEPPAGNARASSTSRLACVRRSYRAERLSEGVMGIIRKSWRDSTESSYSSAWRQWDSWCAERCTDPISAPLAEVLEFLLLQFEEGKQYRTINTIRSAISMTHEEVDGTRIGQHPLVSRFLKGVFNSRPPAPKYSSTWDVDVVLTYLGSLPENKELSFQLLSHKVAMLFALASADRCSDLALLDLNFRTHLPDGVKFQIPGLTKTRRRGPPVVALYPKLSQNDKLCPVEAVKEYEKRTQEFRSGSSDTSNPLFLSVRKPHKPVKACTIGHWLKSVMSLAGVDTGVFSAHSTRGAATSKAKAAGVSIADIMKTANWSSPSTFSRFYHRPIEPQSSQFGRSILRTPKPSNIGELQTYHIVN